MNRFVQIQATYPKVPSGDQNTNTVTLRLNFFTWKGCDYDPRCRDAVAIKAKALLQAQGILIPSRLEFEDILFTEVKSSR